MSSDTCVRPEWLRQFCTRLQIGFGIPESHAEIVSDCLVEANLMGLDTHGVIRLKFYLDRIKVGGNNPNPNFRRLRDNPCTALLDVDNALGPVGGKMAMDLAIEKAAANGLGLVLVAHCNHYGPAGYYARMAVPHDMIGLSLSNVLASMPPTGGAEARVGNNPYAVAIGAGEEPPVVVDGATSKASWGKVFLCAQSGDKLPEDCYVDAAGKMTVDPQAVINGGCLLPIAGHKGYGIAVAIELLTGMLAGAALDHEILHPYKHLDKPGQNTFLMGAVRIDQFAEPADFKQRLAEWVRLIRNTRKAPGVERIWLPGEMEIVTRQQRLAAGIPLPAKMLDELKVLAEQTNVPFQPEMCS
ncbi:MAG: Ldh family oxidoreductase [Candidatus Omnitrophica bacterium]|nr:Ldh family oxidoreductase [Candidatus Omnitrophota bacterium]